MPEDIRDKPHVNQKDVLGLNFIRAPGIYLYRRHYREGLRSHIMEVLNPKAAENETKGIIIDGLRSYPKAEPLKMLRIFRTRFNSLTHAEEELKRVRIIGTYLAPHHVARSEEFLVDYTTNGRRDILLCGLQEYVKGEILDPWGLLDANHLRSLLYDMGFENSEDSVEITNQWPHTVRQKAGNFVGKVKQMIAETNHVPDLAGLGNLLLTRSGDIKLVDINNISWVSYDRIIKLDDRGYPVCDKSIEALSLLEQKLLDRSLHEQDTVYATFLDPERMKEVRALEEEFYLSMGSAAHHSGSSRL